MTTQSYKISDRLFLNSFEVPHASSAKPVETNSNHVLVVDCSGSMSYDLPKIREQLKKKLPKMLKEKDTISIVWFSGKGQFGTLIEAEPVATLADLKAVNEAIDRWLKPVGLTGFKEPLEEVAALTTRVKAKYPANAFSMFYMTDGMDNCWSRDEILKAVDKAAAGLAAATFVEHGYYADRPLLTAMAERAGGSLLFSQDFDKYEANLTDVLARRVVGGKRIEVTLPNSDFIGGIAYALADGDITTYAIDAGKVQVAESTDRVWFLSPSPIGASTTSIEDVSKFWSKGGTVDMGDHTVTAAALSATYAAVSLFATRMKPEIVKPLLKATGDVALISQYVNCFGKQAYSAFMETAKQAAFGTGRWTKGFDPNKVPRDDAFTVLDMLKLLASDDNNRILMAHPAFKYSRIGRGRVDSNTVLTDDEQAEIESLTAAMQATKDPKEVAKISARISEISDKPEALKFEEDKAEAEAGYSVSNLVYNSDRPNVSLQIRKSGTVNLASRKDKPTSVPMEFQTFIYRNYTVIKDGLVNVEVLPVKLSKPTVDTLLKLHADGLIPDNVITGAKGKYVADKGGVELTEAILNFAALPVINGNMVKNVSAKALFEAEYAMTKAKAAQKVYNAFKKEKQPEGKKSEGFEQMYSADAATWLKEQGFTDYSGFNPKSVQAESTDFYMAKELSVSLKGLSSLPALKDVREKMAKGKLTASAALMAPYVTEVENYLSTNKVSGADADAAFIKWIDQKAKDQTTEVRKQMFAMAQTKFSVIVGNTWFSEFGSLDENSMTLKIDGQDIEAKVEMKETKQTL